MATLAWLDVDGNPREEVIPETNVAVAIAEAWVLNGLHVNHVLDRFGVVVAAWAGGTTQLEGENLTAYATELAGG